MTLDVPKGRLILTYVEEFHTEKPYVYWAEIVCDTTGLQDFIERLITHPSTEVLGSYSLQEYLKKFKQL